MWPPAHPWRRLAELAAGQLGLFLTSQALALGITADELERLGRVGKLERWHLGVYAVAGAPVTFERLLLAAQLGLSPSAVGSHGSAGRLHRFPEIHYSPRLELLVPRAGGRGTGAATVHSTLRLPRRDRSSVGSVPVTSVERTICDLAPRHDDVRLRRLVHELWRLDRTDPARIAACLDGLGRVRGKARLRAILAEADPALTRVRSVPEAEAVIAVQGAGLPSPELNLEVFDGPRLRAVLDLAWSDVRLDYEIDGDAYHSIPPDVAQDQQRDDWLESQGWTVRRVSAALVLNKPSVFAARVRADLRRLTALVCARSRASAG